VCPGSSLSVRDPGPRPPFPGPGSGPVGPLEQGPPVGSPGTARPRQRPGPRVMLAGDRCEGAENRWFVCPTSTSPSGAVASRARTYPSGHLAAAARCTSPAVGWRPGRAPAPHATSGWCGAARGRPTTRREPGHDASARRGTHRRPPYLPHALDVPPYTRHDPHITYTTHDLLRLPPPPSCPLSPSALPPCPLLLPARPLET
jgi:hypothetical protein